MSPHETLEVSHAVLVSSLYFYKQFITRKESSENLFSFFIVFKKDETSISRIFLILIVEMINGNQLCSVCTKQLGTSYCTGCGTYFCMKHFRGHRQTLADDLDTVLFDRNSLQEKMNEMKQPITTRNPLYAQIDQWQTATIAKVKQTADQARLQLTELLNSRRSRINLEFKRFSQEIIDMKVTENFVEHDLTHLKRLIDQFYHDLKQWNQPSTIEIHTEWTHRLEWNRLLYVEDKSTYGNLHNRQQQISSESILLSIFSFLQ